MKKIESFKRVILLFMSAICLLGQIGIYAYFWYNIFYPEVKVYLEFWAKAHLLVVVLYGVLLSFFSHTYGGMRIGYLKNLEVAFSQVFATLIVTVVTYAQVSLMVARLFSPAKYLPMVALQIAWVIGCVVLFSYIYKRVFPPRKLLIVHGDRPIDDIVAKLSSRKDKFEVSRCMNISAGIEKVEEEALLRYDAVVLWDISDEERSSRDHHQISCSFSVLLVGSQHKFK